MDQKEDPQPRLCPIYATDVLSFLSRSELIECNGVSRYMAATVEEGRVRGKLLPRKKFDSFTLSVVSHI